jgi:hypothetical protein
VKNSDGYYGLSSSSPAIDASSATYPPVLDIAGIDDDHSLLLDISGRSRPSTATLKDVGCSEYSATGAVKNRPLKLPDVGPSYLGGPVTDVVNDPVKYPSGTAPSGFQLLEAYPNPFNPSTAISYQLSAFSFVELNIYDALGREVAKLIDEEKPAGWHKVVWSARDLPSGVYVCRLVAGQYADSKKLLLMK